MQIRHTGIYVNDLECMKEFYCKYFDMQIAVHVIENGDYIDTLLGIKDASLEIYKITALKGGMIELLKYNHSDSKLKDGERIWETGKMHIALSVDDVERKYQELSQAGIRFLSPPCTSPSKSARVCFCRDPEGNYLELVEEL